MLNVYFMYLHIFIIHYSLLLYSTCSMYTLYTVRTAEWLDFFFSQKFRHRLRASHTKNSKYLRNFTTLQ